MFRRRFEKLLFYKIKKPVYQNIYSVWCHKAILYITLGRLRMLQHFNEKQTLSFSIYNTGMNTLDLQIRRSESYVFQKFFT